jgi:hypothetical protein
MVQPPRCRSGKPSWANALDALDVERNMAEYMLRSAAASA